MIQRHDISIAGTLTKPHGIKGELTARLCVPAALLEQHPMFICAIDGIYVPFFIESLRARGAQAVLIKPEGIDSDVQAKPFADKDIYVLKSTLAGFTHPEGTDCEDEGAYADDLAGYTVTDKHAGLLGVVTGIEDSTANALFILRTPDDKTLYIPIAAPLITAIDHEGRTMHTDLPPGLADLRQ